MKRFALVAALLVLARPAAAGPAPNGKNIAEVKRLYAEGKWEEIVRRASPGFEETPELDYYRGLALAHLARWAEARAAFQAGERLAPRDNRFSIELAGVAYREKHFGEAKAELRRALRLDPRNAYAQNFLATLYLLDGNLPAALDHWNRTGQPEIQGVDLQPPPRIRAALLERAFQFAPLGVLRLGELQASEARLENLGVFSQFHFELAPAEADAYRLRFRSIERNGWGSGRLDSLFRVFGGLPYQEVTPAYYNWRESAVNFTSLLRWDAQKRRAAFSASLPLAMNPKWRIRFYFDGRNENWDLSRTFAASTAPVTDLKLYKAEAGAEIRSVESGRWSWRSGAAVERRSFHNFGTVAPEASPFFTGSFSVKDFSGVDYVLFRDPGRRLKLDSQVAVQFGKIFARPLGGFAKLDAALDFDWFPEAHGDDYETNLRVRVGRAFGQLPLDELYILGVERDNDLWLRGVPGTRDGKKGSAPLGRRYALINWETDKNVYDGALFQVKLGPFFDLGRISDSSGAFVSEGWLADPGVECKLSVLGSVTLVLSYGRDVRSGRGAFYTTLLR